MWVEHGEDDYVFNGVSGGLLRVPREERARLEAFLGEESDDCSPDLLERLARGRMLIGDETDELALLSRRYHGTRWNRGRLGLTVVTSLGCNFDCPYCFEDKHHSLLSSEVEAAIIGIVDEQIPQLDHVAVTWYGGEPLLGKRALFRLSDELIARCDAADVAYSGSIVTNGYLLDEATCEELASRRIDNAQVTIDGPPDVHNKMRPLVSGGKSFDRIVANLKAAVRHMSIAVRVNLDTSNVHRVEELMKILADEGLSGKLGVYAAQLTQVDDGAPAPSASYATACFSCGEFSEVQSEFRELAESYGFDSPSLPGPSGAPCTAVRANELVIGSKGELYKCWDSVGNPAEVVGHIRDYRKAETRAAKWLSYDPFENDEWRSCIALPVCMGGCAHHGMDEKLYDDRCMPFRWNYAEQVRSFVKANADGTAEPVVLSAAGHTR
jgi:uncharacterized protein